MVKPGARIIASTAAAGLAAASVLAAVPAQSSSGGDITVSAPAKKKNKKSEPLKVMTLNLYLGGSLGKVIEAIGTGGAIFDAANGMIDTMIANDFPKRAKWIAQTVKKADPDVITLNELTNWATTGALPKYDYLQIFLDALEQKGMKFKVASLVNNADIGLDLTPPGASAPNKSPVPYSGAYPGCASGCGWRLQDRDAVLYNTKSKGLKFVKGSDKQGSFSKQQEFSADFGSHGKATVDFNRGWASAQLKWQGKKFTMMTAHYEVESTDGTGDPTVFKSPNFDNWPSEVQVAQGKETLKVAKKQAKKTDGRVILAGDLNTDANGYYSPTYKNLTKKFFTDSWKQVGNKFGYAEGATCCHEGTLSTQKRVPKEVGSGNVKGPGKYMDSRDPVVPTRLDVVLNRKATATKVAIVGTDERSSTQPRWESDHNFYYADVVLK